MKYLLIILIPFFAISCKSLECCKNSKKVNKLVLEYIEAPVSPKTTRNIKFTIDEQNIGVLVTSFGETITDTTIKIEKKDFLDVLETYDSIGFSSVPNAKNTGCMGGSTCLLKTMNKSEKIIFDGLIHFCGGHTFGNMTGDVMVLKNKIISKISDFEKILKKTDN